MKIFFDTEFTGLHQATTLISIGLCCEGRTSSFYAELTDYDLAQVDGWIHGNVLAHLRLGRAHGESALVRHESAFSDAWQVSGNKAAVRDALYQWLQELSDRDGGKPIEMWSDCLAYDWVLFCDLFGGTMNLPDSIYYIPFDLSTLLKIKGVDPDISREGYAQISAGTKHTADHDAAVIYFCYQKAMAA